MQSSTLRPTVAVFAGVSAQRGFFAVFMGRSNLCPLLQSLPRVFSAGERPRPLIDAGVAPKYSVNLAQKLADSSRHRAASQNFAVLRAFSVAPPISLRRVCCALRIEHTEHGELRRATAKNGGSTRGFHGA